jgi:hypothetical protein
MRTRTTASTLAVAALTLTSLLGTAVSAEAAVPAKYKNCTNLHKTFPHGVGRSKATDHTSGRRVTTFKHSTAEYNKAFKANRGLDRDRDGIACEKR